MGNRRGKSSSRNPPRPKSSAKRNSRPVWWKQSSAKILALVVAPGIAGLVGSWLLWAAGPSQPSPSATGKSSSISNHRSATNSGPPLIIEDVRAGPWEYASFVSPRKLVLSKSQLAALDSSHSNAGFGAVPSGDAITNQEWITLTVAGDSSAPVTIDNIGIVKHCQAPLTRGATLFYAPQGAGSMNTSPVYFNLDQPIVLGQYLSARTGKTSSNFFAKYVVTLKYHEPWTFAIFAVTDRHYCQFSFRMSVATTQGTVTETVNNHGKPFLLTSDGETMDKVPFSSYAVVYALSAANSQDVFHYFRVNPATYNGSRNPAAFPLG